MNMKQNFFNVVGGYVGYSRTPNEDATIWTNITVATDYGDITVQLPDDAEDSHLEMLEAIKQWDASTVINIAGHIFLLEDANILLVVKKIKASAVDAEHVCKYGIYGQVISKESAESEYGACIEVQTMFKQYSWDATDTDRAIDEDGEVMVLGSRLPVDAVASTNHLAVAVMDSVLMGGYIKRNSSNLTFLDERTCIVSN